MTKKEFLKEIEEHLNDNEIRYKTQQNGNRLHIQFQVNQKLLDLKEAKEMIEDVNEKENIFALSFSRLSQKSLPIPM